MNINPLSHNKKNYRISFVLALIAMLVFATGALAAGENPALRFAPVTQTFLSGPTVDGWILESGENSNVGGQLDWNTALFAGDDVKNKQYVSILSFNTWKLPPYAVVKSAQLRLKKLGFAGNPFATLGDLVVDIRGGPFNQNLALELEDFSAPADLAGQARLLPVGDEWYAADLSADYIKFITGAAVTQFRLRFALDDNNNSTADYVKFLSGNADGDQPQLIVTYEIAPPPAPEPLTPSSPACSGAVKFSWKPDIQPTTQYYFEYLNASGTPVGNSGWSSATNYSANLSAGTYTWHVKARSFTGESAWGTSATLVVNNCLLPPVLISPANGSTIYTAPVGSALNPMIYTASSTGNITFTWGSVSYATEYYFEYSDTSTFTTSLGNSGWIGATNYSTVLSLGTYYWRVKARDATNESGWSEVWKLTLSDSPASIPTQDGVIFLSGNDGWILESSENSNVGGLLDWNAALFVGDDDKNKQYVSILSFNTWKLPPNAVIRSAQLRLKKLGFVGNPFTTLGDLVADIRTGPFNNSAILELEDFSAPATLAGQIRLLPVDNEWYAADLGEHKDLVSKYAVTQFRLHFTLDDNNNSTADYLKFLSGNADGDQPQLVVKYDLLPPPAAPQPSPTPSPVCIGTINFSWQADPEPTTEYYFEYTGTVSGNSGWISATNYSTSLNAGTYIWHVKARNAGGESPWSADASLTVGDCPVAPTLVSPPNTAIIFAGATNFSWNPSTYATQYYFEYDDTSVFDTPLGNSGWISATTYSATLSAGKYYWRVKALNAISESGWSNIWEVNVSTPLTLGSSSMMAFAASSTPAATLENNSIVFAGMTTFTWGSAPENIPVSGAAEYYLEYSGPASGNSGWISGTSYSANLDAGTYTWHVKTRNAVSESQWSDSWTLIVSNPPTLSSPANGATLLAGSVNFTWNTVNGAAEYYVEYSGAASGNSGWISGTNYSANLPSGVYTWRVKARNAINESQWSVATWTFYAAQTRDKGAFSWYNYDPFKEYPGVVDPQWREQWKFNLTALQTFQVQAATTSGNLVVKLVLYDSNWTLLDTVTGSGALTTLTAVQPAASYFIIVEQSGGTSGAYSLRFSCTINCPTP
jgi:hypothetical protein